LIVGRKKPERTGITPARKPESRSETVNRSYRPMEGMETAGDEKSVTHAQVRFIGKSLRDLDLRNRYGIQVIAVRELVPQDFTCSRAL